jgi:hypothetical protein
MRVLLYSAGLCCVRVISCAWVFFYCLAAGRMAVLFNAHARQKLSRYFCCMAACGYRSAREISAVCGSLEHQTQSHALTHTQHQSCCGSHSLIMILLGALRWKKSARPGQRAASLASASSRGALYGAGPVWAKQAAITTRACGPGNLSSRFLLARSGNPAGKIIYFML